MTGFTRKVRATQLKDRSVAAFSLRKIGLLAAAGILVMGLAGWVCSWSGLLSEKTRELNAPPGSNVDRACQAVYLHVRQVGFAGRRIEAQGEFTIDKAEAFTGKEAKSRFNASPAISDTAELCYVAVRGNIVVGSPFGSESAHYASGFALYDARTFLTWQIGSGDGL